jgi:hypothetical protein
MVRQVPKKGYVNSRAVDYGSAGTEVCISALADRSSGAKFGRDAYLGGKDDSASCGPTRTPRPNRTHNETLSVVAMRLAT